RRSPARADSRSLCERELARPRWTRGPFGPRSLRWTRGGPLPASADMSWPSGLLAILRRSELARRAHRVVWLSKPSGCAVAVPKARCRKAVLEWMVPQSGLRAERFEV